MAKALIATAATALDLTQRRVLLVNPPVIDRRYPWVKWNQPLDLLKLGSLLRDRGLEVRLYDFMLPTRKGAVPRRRPRMESDLTPDGPALWHYGQSWESFDEFLDGLQSDGWFPEHVWVTTLTSFWWQSVPMVAGKIKNKLNQAGEKSKRPTVVVCGNYATLETQHAAQFCFNVDIIVRDRIDLTPWPADLKLYPEYLPRFLALDLDSKDPLEDIGYARDIGISHFTFFNDNLFERFDTRLKPLLEGVVDQKWELWFHGICGVEMRDFPIEATHLLAKAHLNELHFEPAVDADGLVDEGLYRQVMEACEQEGFVSKRDGGWDALNHRNMSGFLWIGKPDDDLEKLVWNALKLVQLVGMVIAKPYSPTPGSDDYHELKARSGWLEPEDVSPHRLPFAPLTGINADDYADFYRMTAFLNYKVRSSTFDFLGDSFLAKVIRESLEGRRWAV